MVCNYVPIVIKSSNLARRAHPYPMTEIAHAIKIQTHVRRHQTKWTKSCGPKAPGSGIGKLDLETNQNFWRTLICGPNRKWWSLLGNVMVRNSGVLTRDMVISELKNYSGRYGHIYSKGMVGTERQLNAAFKVKFICEALAGSKMGHWDDTHNKWTSDHETREYLTEVECAAPVLYREALKVICGKIAAYHTTTWFRVLINMD